MEYVLIKYHCGVIARVIEVSPGELMWTTYMPAERKKDRYCHSLDNLGDKTFKRPGPKDTILVVTPRFQKLYINKE